MNEHIELVKKWLENKDSVSLEELEANMEAVYYTANAACVAVYYAANKAANNAAYAANTAYWVNKYEELTK